MQQVASPKQQLSPTASEMAYAAVVSGESPLVCISPPSNSRCSPIHADHAQADVLWDRATESNPREALSHGTAEGGPPAVQQLSELTPVQPQPQSVMEVQDTAPPEQDQGLQDDYFQQRLQSYKLVSTPLEMVVLGLMVQEIRGQVVAYEVCHLPPAPNAHGLSEPSQGRYWPSDSSLVSVEV